MSNITVPEGYYSEEQVSQFLGKAISTLRSAHSRRKDVVPPKTKIGGHIIYSIESFKNWLQSKEIKPFERRSPRERRGAK